MTFKPDVLLYPHEPKRNMLCSSTFNHFQHLLYNFNYLNGIQNSNKDEKVNIQSYGRCPTADDHFLTATAHVMKLEVSRSW
jgi:hypothetical protein